MPKSRCHLWHLLAFIGVFIMSWRVVLINQGEYLNLKLDNIIIKKGGLDYSIPLSDISIIVVEGFDTIITTRLLDALTKYNISLVTCDNCKTPSGVFAPLNGHSRVSKLIKEQINWDDELKGLFWKKIIEMKINNQISVLENLKPKEMEYIEKLYGYLDDIQLGDTTNREGHAAKIYFNSLFDIDFIREDKTLVINACLNYGYAIIRAYLARLTIGYGLVGYLGLFHRNEYNHFNLTDDLIEPFRQFVDCFVYENYRDKEYLSYEMRQELVDLLNRQVNNDGKKTLLCNLMENYVIKFITAINKRDQDLMVFPDIKGLLKVEDGL